MRLFRRPRSVDHSPLLDLTLEADPDFSTAAAERAEWQRMRSDGPYLRPVRPVDELAERRARHDNGEAA